MTATFALLPFALVASILVYRIMAWRTTYENHAWFRITHRVTGEHHWVRKSFGGYSPIPWLDDDGCPQPLGQPPEPKAK